MQVRDFVDDGVEREESWACRTSHYRLDEGHLDIGEVGLDEDVHDDGCSSNSVLIDKGTRIHPDTYDKRAERLGLPSIGVSERIDGHPHYANGFELVTDSSADGNPSRLNSVTVDQARFTDDGLGLRSLAYKLVWARRYRRGRSCYRCLGTCR